MVREIRALERIFNLHDADSAISRFRIDHRKPPPELRTVLTLAERWSARTLGAFDPYIDGLRALWEESHLLGIEPAAASIEAALLEKTPATVNLNAIAKGWIVDRALDVARNAPRAPQTATINAGGDIAHFGPDPIVVGIEDPQRPYDNAAPTTTISLQDAAVATSGPAHRRIGEGAGAANHVIDPRTGRPADGVASATVVAPDAATADVLATALSVLHPLAGIELIGSVAATSALIIDDDGQQFRSATWADR